MIDQRVVDTLRALVSKIAYARTMGEKFVSPMIVTGLPRSGTSWVGKMLASGGAVYVNEPLNPSHPPGRSPGILDADVTHYFQYVCQENEDGWLDAFRAMVSLRYGLRRELRRNHGLYDVARAIKYARSFRSGRRSGQPALISDPYALLSVPWLVDRIGLRAVVLVRDPVAVVGSWHRLGWVVDPSELLTQPLLMRDHLGPYRRELEAIAGSGDWLAATAILWRVAYAAIHKSLVGRDDVLVHRYEDLALEPVKQFRSLYEDLGLRWNDAAEQRVIAASSGRDARPGDFRWTLHGGLSRTAFRRMNSASVVASQGNSLNPDQRERVLALTSDVRELFY